MGGQPIKIGPFVGGLNTYSDTTAVGDNEAIELVNFDIDVDGSLKTRPPIAIAHDTFGLGVLRVLGYYTSPSGEKYLIYVGTDIPGTYTFFGGGTMVISGTFSATSFVQYADKAWLVAPPGSAVPGGSWEPSGGFTAVAAMPKGSAAVVYKERMFIGEGGTGPHSNRLYFSNPANLTTWGASDFLDVKTGDGQDIVDVIVFADTVVIFKQDSTYIYSYESKPATGQVRVISSVIGIDGPDCLIEYENSLYIMHNSKALVITNWNYEQVNMKVPFEYSNATPTRLKIPFCVSRVGDRLIYRYFDRYYVYGLKTRSWTTWTTTWGAIGKFWEVPYSVSSSSGSTYLAHSSLNNKSNLYSFIDGYSPNVVEAMSWSVITKSYDFETPYTFKKLYWWGLDCIAKSVINATVYPLSYGRSITWTEAKLRTWAQAKAYTWGRGGDISIQVGATADVQGSTGRTFIKFPKALRFRQLNLKISGAVDGTSTTSPVRIFAMTAIVDSKQPVVATIT